MLNISRVSELKAEIGEEDFAEIVGLFCEEVEELLDELPGASPSTLPKKLHSLKGSALNIGFDAVGELCRITEARLRTDPAVQPDFAAIRTAYAASKADLLG